MAKIGEFLRGVQERLEEDGSAKIFFEVFLADNLMAELNRNTPDVSVDLETEILDQETWQAVYSIAAGILWDAACRNSSEAHPDIFEEATKVSIAFCEEVNDRLHFGFEAILIKSPTAMMAEAGLVKVVDGFVELTPTGEQAAKEIGDIVKK